MNRRSFLKNTSYASAFIIVPRHVLGKGYTAPSDRINFGFIGCGKQAPTLREQFLETGQVQFVAAADVFKSKTERFIRKVEEAYAKRANRSEYKSCQGYADFRELLQRKDIDAVIVATPDHWHGVIAVKACQAGKDVYCEKPLSLTVAEGRAMVEATRKHNRVFQTGSMQRSWKEFRQAVELVRNGYIGEVKTVQVNIGGPPIAWNLQEETLPQGLNWDFWLGPNTVSRSYNKVLAPTIEYEAQIWPLWRSYADFGGGGMTDWGAHMFDIAQWGLDIDGSGPVRLFIDGPNKQSGLTYEYANGVRMIHEPQPGKQFCHFKGTEGEVWVARGELKTTPETLKDKTIGGSDKRVYFTDNHYQDFLNAIKSRKAPICDVETGHRTATVCNIGNIAYQLGRNLEWDPGKETFNDAEANQLLSRPMRKEWKS